MNLRPAIVVVVALTLKTAAFGHELRPACLRMTETQPGRFAVVWKVPRVGDMMLSLHLRWPAGCRDVTPVVREPVEGALVERRVVEADAGLAGREIVIDGLAATMTDVLVRVEFLDGRVQSVLVKPNSPSFAVQSGKSWHQTAGDYVVYGIQHIWSGFDHLLFVFGMLLLVARRWMLVKTVTAFTAAHSITLAIAALGYAAPPVAPVEAAIALSILFLGPEIVRAWRGQSSITIRRPWLVAFAFGLLHGFGFAGALTGAGLPRADLPLALVSFNVGVEAGQLAFVLAILLAVHLVGRLRVAWPSWVARGPAYVVGSLGAFWTIQRVAAIVALAR